MPHALPSAELPDSVDVLGLPVRPLDIDGLVDAMVRRARGGIRTTACYANAHTVNLAWRDPRFGRLLDDCELLYADGQSVVWASRFADRPLPERMTAMDVYPRLMARCAAAGLRVFLLGSRDGIAERAARKLLSQFEGLEIVGSHSGFFDDGESAGIIDAVNAARTDVLLVGMSSPRQERWLAAHRDAIAAPVRWCVGALFDYLAGAERRGPAWLCRSGGEWVYRLAVDPLGKWRRYLLGNPAFVLRTFAWAVGRRRPGTVRPIKPLTAGAVAAAARGIGGPTNAPRPVTHRGVGRWGVD